MVEDMDLISWFEEARDREAKRDSRYPSRFEEPRRALLIPESEEA